MDDVHSINLASKLHVALRVFAIVEGTVLTTSITVYALESKLPKTARQNISQHYVC